MKISTRSVLISLFIIAALASAFAASNTTTLTVYTPLQVNGTKLDSGSYKVTWTTNGDKAEVLFKSGKNEVKATATLEEAKTAYPNTAIMRTNEGVVKQLWIGGKTTTLVFSEKEKLNTQGE
jgi:Protein of unknown function (DUF2911)